MHGIWCTGYAGVVCHHFTEWRVIHCAGQGGIRKGRGKFRIGTLSDFHVCHQQFSINHQCCSCFFKVHRTFEIGCTDSDCQQWSKCSLYYITKQNKHYSLLVIATGRFIISTTVKLHIHNLCIIAAVRPLQTQQVLLSLFTFYLFSKHLHPKWYISESSQALEQLGVKGPPVTSSVNHRIWTSNHLTTGTEP